MTFTISCRYCGAATGGIFQHSEWSCPYGVQRQGDPVQGEVTALKLALESLRAERDRLAALANHYRSESNRQAERADNFKADYEGTKIALGHLCMERDKLRAALEFYADKENWDDDQYCPTIWDDGSIDLGKRAREALAERAASERSEETRALAGDVVTVETEGGSMTVPRETYEAEYGKDK